MSNKPVSEKTHIDVWKECLSLIKENVPFITYNTWFLPIKPLDLQDNTLKIQVPNSFFIEWIEEHFNTLINKAIKQVLGQDCKLVYVILDESKDSFDVNYTDTIPKAAPVVK